MFAGKSVEADGYLLAADSGIQMRGRSVAERHIFRAIRHPAYQACDLQ